MLDHLRNHQSMAHTTEKFPKVSRTMGNFQANYHEMFADTAGGDYPKTGKFHESIIYARIYKKKLLSEVVTPVLHMRLGTVLKLYQILPTKTQQKDTSGKKHCQNRTRTTMGENECKSFRIRSRKCK